MKSERWAWFVVWAVGYAVGLFSDRLVGLWGVARTAGLYGLTAIALGCCWYYLHPKPLLDRMRLVGVAILLGSSLALVFGGEISHPTVRSMIGVGVLAGLILAELQRSNVERQPDGQPD